jgi:hypothetical protein
LFKFKEYCQGFFSNELRPVINDVTEERAKSNHLDFVDVSTTSSSPINFLSFSKVMLSFAAFLLILLWLFFQATIVDLNLSNSEEF